MILCVFLSSNIKMIPFGYEKQQQANHNRPEMLPQDNDRILYSATKLAVSGLFEAALNHYVIYRA